jgi:hypothetical protein
LYWLTVSQGLTTNDDILVLRDSARCEKFQFS